MTEEHTLHNIVEHLHGPTEVPYGGEELVVVCLVRDGRPYVRSFVEHYRSLGAKHIFFLDNGSTDGTVEALQEYEGVTVLRTQLPYKLENAPLQDDPRLRRRRGTLQCPAARCRGHLYRWLWSAGRGFAA